jgi:hypothetical protein
MHRSLTLTSFQQHVWNVQVLYQHVSGGEGDMSLPQVLSKQAMVGSEEGCTYFACTKANR